MLLLVLTDRAEQEREGLGLTSRHEGRSVFLKENTFKWNEAACICLLSSCEKMPPSISQPKDIHMKKISLSRKREAGCPNFDC